MTGGECLLRSLVQSGVRVAFMNPGTSEMQFVAALDRVPEMRGVLCLFEGVCAGAADGYARMTRRPAATLLHLGPGLGNAIANLHNARKARSPLVNIVGEHSTQHLQYDAPLTADIEATARPVSAWVRTVAAAANVGESAAAAVHAALGPPGRVATLIVPADFTWSEAGAPAPPLALQPPAAVDSAAVDEAARALRAGDAGLVLSGAALLAPGLAAAARTGARVFADRYAARTTRGRGVPPVERIPYFPEPAQELLAPLRHLVLVETNPPVSFFGYPSGRSLLAPEDCAYTRLNAAELTALADLLSQPAVQPPQLKPPTLPDGPLTPDAIGQALAALLPEDAIVCDESITANEPVWRHLAAAAPHDYLPVTGGSIGQGLPVALGAALACPGRRVVALEADGSGMYTLQALWTMARERLDVTVVILANRRYRILEVEMERTGSGPIGARAERMIDLRDPELDWVKLAAAQGVAASRAMTAAEFSAQLASAFASFGPRLIEALL